MSKRKKFKKPKMKPAGELRDRGYWGGFTDYEAAQFIAREREDGDHGVFMVMGVVLGLFALLAVIFLYFALPVMQLHPEYYGIEPLPQRPWTEEELKEWRK